MSIYSVVTNDIQIVSKLICKGDIQILHTRS